MYCINFKGSLTPQRGNELYKNTHSNILYSIILTVVIGIICPIIAVADIYSSKNEQGNIVYSDQKSPGDSQISKPSGNASYYTPVKILKTVKLSPEQPSSSKEGQGSTGELLGRGSPPVTANKGLAGLTEPECQREYSRSCDQLVNWKKYAIESCGDDSRCEDDDYLTRKFKPVTTEELLSIARRAAVRNNREDEEITNFLKRKYTNYCNRQASLSCRDDEICNQKILNTCKDPRSLEDIFSKYNNLNILEKEQIISQAQVLAMSNGANEQSYNKKIVDLLSLLLTRTLLGF